MTTKLTLRPQDVCGSTRFYVIDENQAVQMRKITKSHTLTKPQIDGLKYFGFEFDVQTPTYDL